MRKLVQHATARVMSGVVFLIPLMVIIVIIQKLWTGLNGAGNFIVKTFGLHSLLGNKSVPIATALVLVILFYLCGLLVKFSMLTSFKDWLERSVLQYIPGYITYRAQIEKKIKPKQDSRIPVLVQTQIGKKPGLVIEERADESVVYFPNCPDSNNGEVLMVPNQQLTKLDIKTSVFIKSIQAFGKGIIPAQANPVRTMA